MGFFDGAGSGLLSGAADIAGGFLQQDWNKRSSQRAMDFSERMSSTAYQRGVADMKKAGLNPILAAGGGGASSPVGVGMPGPGMAAAGTSVGELIRKKGQTKADIDVARKTLSVMDSQELKNVQDARASSALADLHESEAFSAKNKARFEAGHPGFFGAVDAIGERLGVGARVLGTGLGIGAIMKMLFGGKAKPGYEGGAREIKVK